MYNSEELKDRLLQTNYFLDNNYLTKYVNLIVSNYNTKKVKFKTQSHHILQRKYFKIVGANTDETNSNKVNLLYKDHILAHYFLCKCTISDLHDANVKALVALVNKDFRQIQEDWLIENLPEFQIIYEEQKEIVASKFKGVTHPGHPHSADTKLKIAMANSGKIVPDEVKQKMKAHHYDCTGANNPASGRHWYNNGKDRLYLRDTDEVPEGFTRGNLPLTDEDKMKKSISNKGKHEYIKGTKWFNNGVISIMAKTCPEGFVPGRLEMNNTKEKIGTKNKIWITNGIITKYIDKDEAIPAGFTRGRKYKRKSSTRP